MIFTCLLLSSGVVGIMNCAILQLDSLCVWALLSFHVSVICPDSVSAKHLKSHIVSLHICAFVSIPNVMRT